MSTRTYPDVGDGLLTKNGVEIITEFDMQRDQYVTKWGRRYNENDVLPRQAPIDGTPKDLELWLICPWQVVISYTEDCKCTCGKCSFHVVQRGNAPEIRTHHPRAEACRCAVDLRCCLGDS